MKRAYYSNEISSFNSTSINEILGTLIKAHEFSLDEQQRNSWLEQIKILQTSLKDFPGKIYFEYSIPRVGKRVDVIIISGNALLSIEFKVGATQYDSHAQDQALDYALDLKNFHEGSHQIDIFPFLVATHASNSNSSPCRFDDGIWSVIKTNSSDLRNQIDSILMLTKGPNISTKKWEESGYKPTPTIVEAAKALYSGHKVNDISRSDAGAVNLSITSEALKKIIDDSISQNIKTICLVTGVPGAGKTLVGLDLASSWNNSAANQHAVLLSGNGPLVNILQEALARDEVLRSKSSTPIRKNVALPKAKAFIQNIHHFRDDGLKTTQPPAEKVVIFDEAQRAWNLDQTSKFMKTKKGVLDFNKSEPEFLIELMDRHQDWAVVVCLVGGGQEINTGEAGISEWLNAIRGRFPHWRVCLPKTSSLQDVPTLENFLKTFKGKHQVVPQLHLTTSMRSFRSEKVSDFFSALIEKDHQLAKSLYLEIKDKYPLRITRNLDEAKKWVIQKSRGNERIGLLASSSAGRLKAHGINVKTEIDPVIWFLNDKSDVRSSNFMEDLATEFQVQGLELDWACLAWDIDFLLSLNHPTRYRTFTGTKWNNIQNESSKNYLMNKYRVLLTRARQGMIIYIPHGDDTDATRPTADYDELYSYLSSIIDNT